MRGEWGSEAERELAALWGEALGVAEVGPDDNFFDLGGDSILTLQIISRARQAGIGLTPRQFLQHQTVAQLAAVAQRLGGARFEQEAVTGPAPLTPIQHWFFEQDLPNPHHWNQAVLLELRREPGPALLEEAIRGLLTHHDALRLRFERTEAGWRQFNEAAEATAPLTYRDLSSLPAERQDAAVEEAAARAQAGLNISTGPLMRAVLFRLGEARPARLLLVVHHLAVDGVSWRILLEDIQTALRQLGRGEAVSLPHKTSSYKRWAERLAEYARGAELEQESAYWLGAPHAPARALPSDFTRGPNTEESAGVLSVAFSPEETRALLREVPSVYHAQVNDVLLLALAQAFSAWAGEGSLLVDLEGHGREELFEGVDVSRTVGWFTAVFPVLLRTDANSSSPGEALKALRERLRQSPSRGVGYGALRYLRGDDAVAEKLRALPQAEVSFNYLGQVDQVFAESSLFAGMLEEGAGPTRDPKAPRRYLLDVEGRIVGGRLRLDWRYSKNFHRPATIERLAGEFSAALRAILARSGAEQVGAYTVSDFPLARLEPRRLAQLAAAHGRIEDIYPLSPIQQGLLFHSLYAPESGVYVEQLRCALRGELDAEAFERAWRQVVERHAALRACFVWSDLEEPLQVVRREVDLSLERRDWRGLPADESGRRLDDFLRDDRARGFDLGAPPLMRLALFQTDADAHEFVFSFHHLILDGWSLSALLREVFAAYGESGRREPRAEPPRPYVNYIEWLRRQDLAAAEGFWREYLEGFTAPTPLAVDQSPGEPSGPRGEYAEQRLRLSADFTAALQSFARGRQLTLNTLLQGAWSVLLSRYSGEQDVLFGITVSGRPADLPGVEAMVGLFINTLPMRARVSPEATPLELLRELQLTQAEVQRYEHSPLVQVQGWSAAPRHLPLFESILVVENYPVDPSLGEGARGLRIEEAHFYERTNYPLTVQAAPGRELLLQITYDRGRFEGDAVGRMLGHYQSLLEAFVAAPERRISKLEMLTPAERERLLVEWNDTAADFPPPQPIHRLFEAQAERRAGAVALAFEDLRITYGELNGRANRLARRLREMGVGPEAVVGVLMERSVEMVVGLLGILKAGGAYLPLDPSYPAERISFMLEDSKVSLLLTQRRLLDGLPPGGPQVMSLDSDWPLVAGREAGNLDAPVAPDNLAYVIYTSGSTGRPKGAMNTHRAIYNRLLWMQEEYKLSEDDRVLQKTPFSFDVSVWEFFWPLLNGAQLVMARPGGHQDSAYLVGVIKELQVTTLHFVPSMLQAFLEEPAVGDCRSLRRVICSGEALPASLQRRFFERLGCELHNLYGPTEAAVDVTYWACRRDDARRTVPIGRPIANIEVYLLDARLSPVPVGVPGELHIGGVGLARGYLRRPGLTAEKFIPDPFGRRPGERLYRTGDLARFLPDGQIEFLGRLDHQIKLRGFRIELGEIEAALAAHPSVEQCVLHTLTDASGEKRLAAYFVPAAGREADPGELRAYLKGRLPEYMVPGVFAPLAAMPLTPNGKVDRRRLPAPPAVGAKPGADPAPPRTDSEKALARLWGEVLGREQIDLHDNFFDLGGHSISALRIVTRLRGAFGLDLSPRALFEHPTVAELARFLNLPDGAPRAGGRGAGTTGPGTSEIKPQARREHLPLSFAQQRFWYLDRLQPGLASYNCAGAVRLTGRLDVEALTAALREIVRRHEVLRTVFPATDEGLPAQVILPGLAPEVPVVSLQHLPPPERQGEAERLMTEEARSPFDLSSGPLFRLRLLRLDEREHVLTFTAHHIIVDAWSMGVLVGELAALYEAALSREPWPLPPLPIQFADYALWQRQRLSGAFLEEQFDYWRRVLAGAPTQLTLPSSRPRPDAPSHRGGRQVFLLPRELSEALGDLSRREGVTLFMTLLAAFKTLLYRYTGQEDILVGAVVANRRHEQAERLIGCFINTLVLRTDLSGGPDFRELLRRTRHATLEAFDHQEMPFEKLVERLQPERSLGHTPLVQVAFGMQNAPMPPLELPGLTLTLLETEEAVARLDLTLWMEERPEGLKASWTYSTDLFDPSEVERMHGHFLTLLSGVAARPQTQIDDLEMLTEAEKEQEASRKRSLREDSYKRLLKVKPKSVQDPIGK
ncbi:MAG TPA: amino acid adenylation domain-containing protein [Pyrinomonadaceae bacterium]